ncbi:tripartite tricarboxylate transporter substrate binding protein [Variovorax sp. J31P207]|uniref:Bug family tripartite tricarboxylate transporter substrate binding protein n=1 Tax=Variovorax sp. J31P207 TaxID=3053510 RepID=UPI0025786ABA|nr:tripartite tricarboxylate transporter substrate binding protein [Variovorax sp. J31P207]MDM0066506.1 tripartite tricarboxylate transporter substrate binding protein [Variovorax sp. J31P207]
MKLKQLARAATVSIGCSLALGAWAFGDKPLKVIVPAPPGGTMDVAARVVGQQMSIDLGRPVIVENRAGATGSIGLSALLKADPDGNTIAMGAINLLVEAPLVMKVPYDPLKDIVTIARVAQTSRVLVTAATNPAKDFQGLVAQLKTRKGQTSFASFGTGTSSHYAGLIFSDQAGLGMQHVGYPGSPPALQDLLGGQVDIMFDSLLTSLPLIKGGKLRAYAVAGKSRSRYFPEVPTMAELGYPDIQFPGQVSFYGASKLSPEVLAKLQAAIKKAADAPAVQQKLIDLGLEPDVSIDTPAMLAETRSLFQRNAAIVKKFDIQPN